MNRHRETLMKFISEQNQKIQNDISKQGYKDNSPYKNNPFNIIQGTPQGTPITMDGVSQRLYVTDGKTSKILEPNSGTHFFSGPAVKETALAKYGGLLNKTIKCSNCGWSWKAADGGNDVGTCHKCGNEVKELPVAQEGVETGNTKKMAGGITKYQEAGTVKKWLGNTLTPEGYITSTTKGGNRISFTGDQRADEWINKQIDSGKFGFDPTTGGTFPLKKPVKGLSKEDQFIGSKAYYDLQTPEGFNTESQRAQIKNLPEFQQELINAENEKRRKRVVNERWDDAYKNPLFYVPGAIATGGLGLLGLEAAGVAAAPFIQGALATQLPGLAAVPGATVGNAITAGFAGHGLANVGPDTVEMYKNPTWGNAGSLAMDALEIAPIVGPAAKTIGEGISTTGKGLSFNEPAYMSLEAPKGNMYGENQVIVQQQRLLNPDIKAKFFKHQAPYIEPTIERNLLLDRVMKLPKDFNNRITPQNYEEFVRDIHGSTGYDLAANSWKKPANLGIGNYGMPGVVYKDAPLNNLGKDIINAHEKGHGIFAGTLSSEVKNALLKPFGTRRPIPNYADKHQGDEVLSRMAQFKNALGMGDNQIFTLGHLNLIRKNYAKQFLDNGITEMLAKIKPGSAGEKEFLKNMNEYAFGATGVGALTYKALEGQEETPEYKKQGGELSKAQFGLPIAGAIANKIASWFSDDEKKPVVRPIPVERTFHIKDPRTIRATTQQPIRPTADLLSGTYNSVPLDKTLREAKRRGLSKNDMWNLAGMALAETGLGTRDYNIGQVLTHPGDEGTPGPQEFVHTYINKMKEANRLGIKDPAMRLQIYNGTGPITPDTEKSSRGYKMQKAYGVPLPKEGISMKKRPLYGINVLDAQNNVLKKNPEFVRYIDSIYKAPVYKQGGVTRTKQQDPLSWFMS